MSRRSSSSRRLPPGGAPGRGARANGFTLLETLVAISLLAVLVASVASVVRLASASVERGEAAARGAASLRASIELLVRAVRSADPAPVPAGDNAAPFFRGERLRLRFLTASPPGGRPGGGLRILTLEEGREGGIALSESSPFQPGGAGADAEGGRSRVLLPGARKLAFSYSAGPSAEGAWEWAPEWEPEEERPLPAAVRVEFFLPADGGERETAFVVPVPAGG